METEPDPEWDDLLEEIASPVLLQLTLGRGFGQKRLEAQLGQAEIGT